MPVETITIRAEIPPLVARITGSILKSAIWSKALAEDATGVMISPVVMQPAIRWKKSIRYFVTVFHAPSMADC
jgi:hypothetical protein